MYIKRATFLILMVIITIIDYSCNKNAVFFATKNDIEFIKGYYKNNNQNANCNDKEFYAGDIANENFYQTKTIKVNFHIFDDKKGNYNFKADSAKIYIKNLLYAINERMKVNKQMHLPKNNATPVLQKRILFELTPDPNITNDDGIYFHTDEFWFLNKEDKMGKTGLYSDYLYKKYGVQKQEVLNVLMLEHHPDSVLSATYKDSGNGLGLQYFMKIVNCYKNSKIKNKGPWFMANLFNHEAGHTLGLAHSWVKNDGCNDTPQHQNCWNYTESGPCSDNVSNNLMDYNSFASALTPCQIGKMHKNIMKENSTQRKITKQNWCKTEMNKNINIKNVTQPTIWNDAKDILGNLIIERGATLVVNCRLGMPQNSKIIVKAGGTFILNNGKINNDCNLKWKGIEIEKNRNLKGKVIFYGNANLENAENTVEVVNVKS